MSALEAALVLSILATNFAQNGGDVIRLTTLPTSWDDSILHCKQTGEELLTPLTPDERARFIDDVTTEAGHFWTGLIVTANHEDTLGWGGIHFYENVSSTMLPWKPGKRPTVADVDACVAVEVTKLSVAFYPESCSELLLSYCRTVAATSYFSPYSPPHLSENATDPFQSSGGILTVDGCAYECLESDECLTYTYLAVDQLCLLFNASVVENNTDSTWTIDKCKPLAAPEHSSPVPPDNSVGDTVDAICLEEYDNSSSTCQSNGRWTNILHCYREIPDCALGDIGHTGVCYRFSSSPQNWNDAKIECQGHDGYLLEIKDEEKMLVVNKMLALRPNETFWTGASDIIQDAWWHWTTEYTSLDYTNWHAVSGDPTGHCVQLRRMWGTSDQGEFFFDDQDCNEERHFICEIGSVLLRTDTTCDDDSWCRGLAQCFGKCYCSSPNNQVGGDEDLNRHCDRGWNTFAGYGISLLRDYLPQDISQEACKREGGSLMAPVTERLNRVLTEFYIDQRYAQGHYFWSSLKTLSPGVYEDIGIDDFGTFNTSYLPWRLGFETELYTPGNCLVTEISKAGVKLIKSLCSRRHPGICLKINAPARFTDEGTKLVSEVPMVSMATSSTDWCGAECLTHPSCSSYGYSHTNHSCHLYNLTAAFESSSTMEVQIWGKTKCPPLSFVKGGRILTGANVTAVGTDVTYKCDPEYHNVTSLTVTCGPAATWSDLPYCQPNGAACPANWTRLGSSCYRLVEMEMSWKLATQHCELQTGYLVELDDEAEHQFIINFLDFDMELEVWTGGYDTGMQHWYRWYQYPYEDMTVIDWFPGDEDELIKAEPTGFREEDNDNIIYEDCIQLRKMYESYEADKYYYSDDECGKSKMFICETKVLNVGGSGCDNYTDNPCKSVAKCEFNRCECPYDTHRQIGPDDDPMTNCSRILPIGTSGCMGHDSLCHNISVCGGDNKCMCPSPLNQNGQDHSFSTNCVEQAPQCMDDWRGLDAMCYMMISSGSDKDINPDQECIKIGSILASATSPEVNDFLLDLGKRANKWIGLHGREGEFQWADRTLLSSYGNFSVFAPPDPDSKLSVNESCIYLSMQGTWIIEECDKSRPKAFICSLPNSCTSPPDVANANIEATEDLYEVGTVLEYTCNYKYVLEGTHTGKINCKLDPMGLAVWDPPPTCVAMSGGVFGDLDGENTGLVLGSATSAPTIDECAQLCFDNIQCLAFSFSPCQAYSKISDTYGPGFNNLPANTMKKRKECPPLPRIKDAELTATDRRNGSSATYTCLPMTYLIPGRTSVVNCQSNCQWEEFPECKDRFKDYDYEVEGTYGQPSTKWYFSIPTLAECKLLCIKETSKRCIALRYQYGECFLYADRIQNITQKGLAKPSTNTVYSELIVADLNEFNTYFDTSVTLTSANEVLGNVSMEECAQTCINRTDFDCQTIMYYESMCELFEETAGGNMVVADGRFVFRRNIGCANPVVPSGMSSMDVIRKMVARYSVGDSIQFTCTNFGEDFLMHDGKIYCQPGGTWTRHPKCRNLCTNGWAFNGGSCYQAFDELQTFDNANIKCASNNASLLTIEMEDELEFINKMRLLMDLGSGRFWIGLYADLQLWTWTVGHLGNTSALGVNLPSVVNDAAIVYDFDVPSLAPNPRTNPHRYVCKKALPNLRCPDDWYYYNRTCYKSSGSVTAATYQDAVTACSSSGHMLATPHSVMEKDFIKLASNLSGNVEDSYIGLQQLANQDWTYVDGSPQDFAFATGIKGLNTGEKCLVVSGSVVNVSSCTEPRPYVCQVPLGETGLADDYDGASCATNGYCQEAGLHCVTPTVGGVRQPPSCRPLSCPPWMKYLRGKCFHVSSDIQFYPGATASCGGLGARIVSIDSMRENFEWLEIFESQIGTIKGFWVGEDRLTTESRFKTNPLDASFDYWVWTEEPDTYNPVCITHSTHLDGLGRWLKTGCTSGQYNYICEKDVTLGTNSAFYKGCYNQTFSPFHPLQRYKETFLDNDIIVCRDHCTFMGYKYAAAMGTECSCGNMYAVNGRVEETKCSTACPGNTDEKCGGPQCFSVYETTGDACSLTMPTSPDNPNRCYSVSTDEVSWFSAQYTCGRNGGDLIRIQSLRDQNFLMRNLLQEPGRNDSRISIGTYTLFDSAAFNYYTGTESSQFQNFFSKFTFPSIITTSNLDCVRVDSDGRWIHTECSKNPIGTFVCEYREKNRHPVGGNMWTRMMLENYDSDDPSTSLIKVTGHMFHQRDQHVTLTSDTTLYSKDLDLGCLNDRSLCPDGFTLTLTLSVDTTSTSDIEIMSTGDCVSSFAVGAGFCIFYKTSTAQLVINDASENNPNKFVNLPMIKGQWYHIAIVFDGTDKMLAYLDGTNVQEFSGNTLQLKEQVVANDAVMFGNWHHVIQPGSSFKLHDVRFKPEKIMRRELLNIVGALALDQPIGFSHWLEDDWSHIVPGTSISDPGVDGQGMRLTHQGALEFISDNGHTCLANLDHCTSDFSLSFWVNLHQESYESDKFQTLITTGDVSGGKVGLEVKLTGLDLHIDLAMTTGQYSINVGSLTKDAWHNIILDYTTSSSLTVYKDGGQMTVTPPGPPVSAAAPMSTIKLGQAQCPPGWVYSGTSCYYFDSSTGDMFYHASRAEKSSAHIVHVDSDEEIEFLREFMNSNGVSEVVMATYNEAPPAQTRFVRLPGGPEPFLPSIGNVYQKLKCTATGCSTQGLNLALPAVYEIELDQPDVEVKTACPDDWQYFEGSCYLHLSSVLESGASALEKCAEVFATPVAIETESELRFVANLAYRGHHDTISSWSFLAGGSREILADGTESYIDRYWQELEWSSWHFHEVTTNLTCLKVQCESGGCFYVDVDCDVAASHAVCERDAATKCGVGWRQIGNRCYDKYEYENITSDYCQEHGYNLAVIDDLQHMERMLYDLNIGSAMCLTDAFLSGANYTWNSTGQVTYFDRELTTKTEQCVTFSNDSPKRGLTPNCDINCVICQRDITLDVSLDNIQFHERLLTAAERTNILTKDPTTPKQLSCPMAPVDIISSSSVTCMLDGATITMTGSGAIETVADHLYKESVTLGDGISGTISGNLLDVTSAKLGITVAFWVYVFPNSSSLIVDSIGTGDSGVQISYTHRSLMAEVMEPNFVWNAKTWFPLQDWTYVTLTWQEALGLSLYINGDLMSKVNYGTPLHGFNTNPSSSNTLQIAQHGEGTEIKIKDFIYTDVVWSAGQIGNIEYGATNLRYLITFDEEYQPRFDNMVMTRNESLTSLVWRNSLFQHSLYVDNMAGENSLPAAISLGQMRNCFTRLESCKSSWSLSFWLRPINFQNPQTYITAYTPSLKDQVRSIAWELTYNNKYDVFELILQREKIRVTFTFKLDFREWSFLHIGMLSAIEHKLYVNGIEQAEPMRTHVANYIEPTQPFSYLEIGSYGHFEIDDIRFYGLPLDPYGYYILKSCLLYELAGLRGPLNLQVGTSFSDVTTTLCNLTGDYNGLSVTFEQENIDNLTAQGISLDYTASNTYQEGINGQSLHLANSGLTLRGTDSDCFKDLTECRLGFSTMMWLKLEIVSTKIQILELGGQPLTSFPGLSITCESIPADSLRVLCISEASSQDVSWQSSFKVQKNRWVHLAVTWNQLLGMSVHLNGHDIAEIGGAVVTSGVALGSIMSPSDIKIGHSSAFSDVGIWSVDDIWLIERDVSLPEIREHFGDQPACVDGWVYNDVTGLCYNITKGALLSSQDEAEDHCQKFGGRLAIEPDTETHTWLKDNILVPSGVTSFVHIGLAKTGQEGTIRRSDGQLASHLPTLNSPTTTYVCVVLKPSSWVYVAKNCHFTAAALCQRPPLWLPNKEISIATENPRFNYTELLTANTPNIMEGIVGDTIDFNNNYAFEDYADECINNFHFCHNGWSLSAWLHIDPPINSSAQEVIYSSVGTSNSYGVTVYGQQDGEFYYINVGVDDSQNKTSSKFEISTHTWMHLYVALSLNTSDITVIFNGLNNTYIEPVKAIGTGVVPDIGTLLPFSVGADSLGGKQMVGKIDEFEVFEHELLDLEEIFLKVSEQHNKSIIVEQNFDYSDMIKNSAFASKLPGKFGYASFIVKNKPITHIGQFAFDCFGSIDMCTNGFTIIMWIQPQSNQSDADFGIVSAINNHRGFKISYYSSHPIYTSEPPSYWFTARDGTKEYDIPFQMPEWYWSFVLFTWRLGQPNLFINSKKMTVVKTQVLTGDSYPVVLLHFGKSDDRVTCLEGFSGGVDDFLFWPEDVTDEEALVLYRERVYVEETIKWNTTASALPGNHLTLTSLTDALDLTANVNANSCFLKSTSCFFGITASIMIRFLDLNDHDQMIFTTGGETDDGSGLYLRLVPNNSSMPFRRYFHLGAKTEDKEFLVVFHLRDNQWTQIIAEFSPKFSLKVFVDKLFVGEDFGTARTVGSSGSDGRLLIGQHTEVVTELPNFEIQHLILWDKAVDASRKGLVEDFMHYVHKSMDPSSDWTMIGTMTYSACLNQCLSDNITECNTFSYCPSIVEGDCYLLADQLLDTDLVNTDQCDAYIPVKMPHIDYFTSCISMTAIASLTAVADVEDWEECRQVCYGTGSRYAGIYEGTKCYCDDAFGTQTTIPTTNCDIDCSTISLETCGGTTSVSVYSCGSLQPLIAPTVSITSIAVALNPGVYVSIGETISLAMSVNVDTFAGYFISTEAMAMDFYTGFNVTEITVNKIGQFTLNVRALNEISYKDFLTTIYIFLPIDDIDTDYMDFAATDEEVAFTATVTNGTNITCEIFFGDGNSDSLFQSDDSVPFVFKHTYLSDGVYNVNITCFNSITTITDEGSIVIQDVITNPLMTTNEPLQHPDPLVADWTIDKGTNTTFTLFLDGVETNLESYIFGSLTGTTSIPQSLYSRTGEHNLVLRATNLVSQEFFNTTVRIEIPVETVTVTPNGTFHVVGGPVHFAVTIAKGSNMTIELHLDDATTVDLTSSSNDINHAISYVHEYSYVGTVEVNITATNIHGAVSNVCTVILETTVADVVITAPDIYNPVDYDLEVIFEVDLPSEVPTNALIDVTFGDSNSVSDVMCDMPTLQQIISHDYNTHGTYAVNVMIYNNASTKSFTRNVQVGGPIANLTVNLNRLYVPHGTPLITTSDVDYGSLITYSYEFGDGTSETRNYTRNYPTAVDVYQHIFPNTLIYGVNITATNSYNSEMQSFFVHVQEKVEGLVLVSNAPVRVNTTMTFYLAMVEAGTDTCFVWDFDDGKKMLYGVPSCPSRPEYENLEFEPVSGIIHTIEHTYSVEGSYNVSVNSSNEVSWDFVTLSVTSLEFLCIEPEVDILGFTYNGISPVTMLKSNRFKVSANIDTQCIPPVNAVFEWRIQEVNVTGNLTNQDIAYLQEISPPTDGLPELTIPKGFLEYGTYKVSLTVSYEKGTDLSSTDFAFVEVGPSMLVALLAGDYFQKAYVGANLKLDASKSYDPDMNDGTSKGLWFKWYCRLENENFVVDANGFPVDVLTTSSPGCFGDGFGYLGNSSETFEIPSSDLVIDSLYVFALVIGKDDRVNMIEQRVEIISTELLPITMRCVDNCGIKTTRNQPLRLASVCQDCSPVVTVNAPYLWELFVIHDDESYEQINITFQAPTGVEGPNLMLEQDLLDPGTVYRVRLTSDATVTERQLLINYPPYGGWCISNRRIGMELETKFIIHCEGWLDEGSRSEPNPDTDQLYQEPISFKFLYKVRGTTSDPHVFYEVTGTQVQTPEVVFRGGLVSEDYEIDIFIEVSDSGGAQNYTDLSIRVIGNPDFIMEVYEGNNYKRFEAEKDISALLVINLGVIEKLNELQNNTNTSHTVTIQMVESVAEHVAEHIEWVETPYQVELVVDILEQVLDQPEELSPQSRANVLNTFDTMFGAVDRIFNESADSVTQQKVSKGMMNSFVDLMMMNTFTSNCESASCESNRELSEATYSVFESRDSVVGLMLQGAVAGEPPILITRGDGEFTYQLERSMTSHISNTSVDINGKELVTFPDLNKLIRGKYVDVELIESVKLQPDINDTVQTRVSSVTLYDKGEKVRVNINSDSELIKVNVYSPEDINTETIDLHNNSVNPFFIQMSLNRSDVTLIFDLQPEDTENATFAYFVGYNSEPSYEENELNGTLPLEDENEADKQWRLTFDLGNFSSESRAQSYMMNTPSVYVGLLALHNVNDTSSVVNLTVYTAGCQYWDSPSSRWMTRGLSYGRDTNTSIAECQTNHLTSFGASFFVPPNTIDFKSVFNKFSDIGNNAAVFATVIAVIVLYFIIVFFVRRADKKDVEKWSVVPMLDNLPSDVYHYQVTVFTGMRRHAGTKSKVFFVLGGEDGDTEIRALEADGKRHERGSVNSFILSVPQGLGHLLFLRIWHDNSGKSLDSDWYLSLVMVKDLQTNEKSVFLCDRWLALDKDDGEIERFLPVSTKEDLESFGHLFSFQARQDLTDGHLWFSVASRPTWSNFTRVQRLSCCLSLLFTTMIANAMWYGTQSSQGTQDVHLGPFTFSPQELTTSFMMSLIVVPINLLIVHLFRKAGPKPKKPKKSKHPESGVELPRVLSPSGIFTVEDCQRDAKIDPGTLPGDDRKTPEPRVISKSSKPKRRCCMFPYWVAYIAWFLVFLSVVVPAFFCILYSLEWGAEKSSRWLTSFILSFLESVVLVQPVKVLAVAIVLSLIFRKMEFEEKAPAEEQEGETITFTQPGRAPFGNYAHPMKPAHRRPYIEKPPDFSTIDKVRDYRKKQNRLIDIVKDIGSYVFYLVIVAIICYENRDEKSFLTVDNIRNQMVKDIKIPGSPDPIRGFEGVSSFENFWEWSVKRLVPALYVEKDFNNESVPANQQSLLSDRIHYRVGPPRLRQARVETEPCKNLGPLTSLIRTCIAEYGVTNYDDKSFSEGWTDLNTSSTGSPTPWQYQTVMNLGGIPSVGDFGTYGGGGYVAVLGNTNDSALDMIKHLKDNKWLDRQTRAVFLEVNLYNPFVNLFCAVSLLLEVPPTGSGVSYTRITPLRLYRYVGPSALFMIVTDIIFVAFTCYFLIRLIKEVKVQGRKFLSKFWNYIEFFNVLAAILCCAFYGVHYIMTYLTINDFHDHPGEFVNFQRIVLWDDVFAFMQGFLLFFSMIKLLRLIRFNAKVTQLSTTLKKSVGPLFNFMIVFLCVFLAFTQFAYLVFGPTSSEYFSFLTSLETLFSMLLMKVNIEQVMTADSVLGPIFLFLFIIMVVFVLLNMLLSILNDVFTKVRLDKRCRPDDPEMVNFMIKELKRVVGISEAFKGGKGKTSSSKIQPSKLPLHVERWLAAENDNDGPELTEDGRYEKITPPHSTGLGDLTKKELYKKQSKDWLKTFNRSTDEA